MKTSVRALASTLVLALTAALAACAPRLPLPELVPPPPAPAPLPAPPPPPATIIEVPRPLPLPGQLKPLPSLRQATELRSPAARIEAANARARVTPTRAGYFNAIQVYPYAEGALYQLYAALHQVSDIALEPGEKLLSVSAGDTVRWVLADTSSGEGKTARVHILVKPTVPGIRTNLLIASDRRTYHLELHATENAYMASLSWTYPSASLLALKGEPGTNAASLDPGPRAEDLRFRYRIDGTAALRPSRVFDDGRKVYIVFPATLGESEAPTLFILGPDGKPNLVNYRLVGSTFIVDRLFAAAELRQASDPKQTLRISRTDLIARQPAP